MMDTQTNGYRRGKRMERVISIIGKSGSLASALDKTLSVNNQVMCYGKDRINMLVPDSITDNINAIKDSDVIIVCSGLLKGKPRDMLDINTSGPIQLLSELVAVGSKAHVVIIGSHAQTWTSWPGIDIDRLTYNVAKKTVSEFVLGLEQSDKTSMKLTIYNVSRFDSNMNSGGMPIQEVVDNISEIIDHNNPPLIFENGKSKR